MPDKDIFDGTPWEAVSDADLGPAALIPTTLTRQEKQLFFWLGARAGAGAFVDLGSFAGCSLACMAQGAASQARAPDLHAFDRFDIQENTKPTLLYDQGVAPFEGTDILWLTKQHLAPFEAQTTYHVGEIADARWPGDKIAILNMDASKDLEKADQMAEDFWPHLIAGESLLVHPDYLHWRQPWIATQMELFSNFFEPVMHAPADTVVFRCIKVPTLSDLRDYRVSYLPQRTRVQYCKDASERLSAFDRTGKLTRVTNAARANPKVTLAWKMKAP